MLDKILNDLKFPRFSISKTNHLNTSELYGMCMRQKVFAGIYLKEPVPSGSSTLAEVAGMESGSFFHRYLQEGPIGNTRALKGGWRCYSCLAVQKDCYKPYKCQCGHTEFSYVEYSMFDTCYRISGHIDGLICLNRLDKILKKEEWFDFLEPDDLCILEIKSAPSCKVRSLSLDTLHPAYKWQASWYQHMAIEQNLVKNVKTLFLFIDRQFGQTASLMYDMEPAIVCEIKDMSDTVFTCIKNGLIPENRPYDCTGCDCTRAKNCYFRDKCYNINVNQ